MAIDTTTRTPLPLHHHQHQQHDALAHQPYAKNFKRLAMLGSLFALVTWRASRAMPVLGIDTGAAGQGQPQQQRTLKLHYDQEDDIDTVAAAALTSTSTVGGGGGAWSSLTPQVGTTSNLVVGHYSHAIVDNDNKDEKGSDSNEQNQDEREDKSSSAVVDDVDAMRKQQEQNPTNQNQQTDMALSAPVPISNTTINDNDQDDGNQHEKPLDFYMLITKGDVTLGKRTPQIAMETACHHHPNSIIYLYLVKDSTEASVSPAFTSAMRDAGCHVELREFDATTFFQDTPLGEWVTKRYKYLSTGKYWYSHQTDLFRLAVLYKYGGWYLDSDVVVLKPLTPLSNCIGREVKDYYNNAISNFDAGHPFLVATMEYVMQTYKRNTWTSAGPTAATEALKLYEHKDCKDPSICVKTLPRSAFFPIVWTKGQDLVARKQDVEAEQVRDADWSKTWALHFWNKRNADLPLYESSVVNRFYQQSCLLCNINFVKDDINKVAAPASPVVD